MSADETWELAATRHECDLLWDQLSASRTRYDTLVAELKALAEKWRALKRPVERMGAEDALVLAAHLCADELLTLLGEAE